MLKNSPIFVSWKLLLKIAHKLFVNFQAWNFPNFCSPKIIAEKLLQNFLTKSCLNIPQFLFAENYCSKSLTEISFKIMLGNCLIFAGSEISVRIRFIICLRSWSNLAQNTSLKALDPSCSFTAFLKGLKKIWIFGCGFFFPPFFLFWPF